MKFFTPFMNFSALTSQKLALKTFQGATLFVFLTVLISAFHPDLRSTLRQQFNSEYRHVLSTASGLILHDHNPLKVVKIKTEKGLFLEFYEENNSSRTNSLIHKVQLPDHRDGYFVFRGQATNLALDDIDGDRQMEVIAPSFDQNMVAHLNVYKYNPQKESFEPLRKQQ